MTEKECLKALDCLYDEDVFDKEVWGFVMEGDNLSCADVERAKKYYRDKIYNLIKEHFDNPPLKFEELKKGMWVWDDVEKCYFKCNPTISTDMAQCVTYNAFWYNCGEDEDEFFEEYDEFEENRFYRKEVK